MPRYNITMPEELWDRIGDSAPAGNRSYFIRETLEAALGGESTAGAGAMKATAQKGPDRKSPLDHDRSPVSPRASVNRGMADPIIGGTLPAPPRTTADFAPVLKQPASDFALTGVTRQCERCGTPIPSPSLTVHPNCGGRIVPPPS